MTSDDDDYNRRILSDLLNATLTRASSIAYAESIKVDMLLVKVERAMTRKRDCEEYGTGTEAEISSLLLFHLLEITPHSTKPPPLI
jgi:hypothetical protein